MKKTVILYVTLGKISQKTNNNKNRKTNFHFLALLIYQALRACPRKSLRNPDQRSRFVFCCWYG